MPEECQGEAKNKKADKLSFVGLRGFPRRRRCSSQSVFSG